MWKFILSKFSWIFKIGVFVHRFFDGCNDLRYELCNVFLGDITFKEFIKQIKPTLQYHLSGKFEKRMGEIYKTEHLGLDTPIEMKDFQ